MNKDTILEKTRYWLSCEREGLELNSNQAFQSWINISNEHKKIFDEEKNFRDSIKNLPKDYKQKLYKQTKEEIKRERFISKTMKTLVPLAACLLIVFSISFFNTSEDIYTNNIYSKNKIIQNILMPDNSKITLDAKTNIEVIYTENKREVFLKNGKAIFEVSSNKNRPFYVKSDSILVQVVGTKFEVNKLKEKTNISVLEGIVNIRQGENEKSRILAQLLKGDILSISNSGKINTLAKSSIEKIAVWKDEKLIFNQTPLNEVINSFSKYLESSVELKLRSKDNFPITGEFGVYEFDKFLEFLPLVYPIKINKNKNNRIILENIT